MPKITGAGSATKRLEGLAGREKVQLVGRALYAGGEAIKAEASHLITLNAVSGKNHVPSAPGQPPNEDAGQLRSGIEVEQPAPLRVLVTSNAPHAVPLENGTSKMEARPSMGPAARAKRKEVVELVGKAVNIATRKKG